MEAESSRCLGRHILVGQKGSHISKFRSSARQRGGHTSRGPKFSVGWKTWFAGYIRLRNQKLVLVGRFNNSVKQRGSWFVCRDSYFTMVTKAYWVMPWNLAWIPCLLIRYPIYLSRRKERTSQRLYVRVAMFLLPSFEAEDTALWLIVDAPLGTHI